MKVLITGATSGFGAAMAEKFAENGYDLILTGRRHERLVDIKTDIEEHNGVHVDIAEFDVRNKFEVDTAFEKINLDGLEILINNAGLASGLEPIQDGDIDDWDKMMDTNVKGLLYVSRKVLPYFKQQKKGHVINIGSTAGKEVYANGGVYCASKHAVDAITKSMRIDLLPYGVKVTQIAPGAAETEFSLVRFKGNEDKAKSVYNGYQPLSAEDVAEVCFYAATLPPHVCINDLVLTSTSQANSFYIHREN